MIVSLTSHTKERLKLVPYYLYHSIIKHKFNYVKIVLTLYKEDLVNIPDYLQILIDSGYVELIIAEENLKCHLKYFYCMKKYRDLPIITIDDDSIYPRQLIPDFLKNAEKYPNTIIARSAVQLIKDKSYVNCPMVNNGVEKIHSWNRNLSDSVRYDLNCEGYGGIYYPANILEIDDNLIDEIKLTPRADDIYLNVIENRKHIPRIVPYYSYNKLDKCTKGFDAISTKSDNVKMIDGILNMFKKDLYE